MKKRTKVAIAALAAGVIGTIACVVWKKRA